MSILDSGVRCDRHIGDAFPPRCGACQGLSVEYAQLNIAVRYIPGSDCLEHPGYPLPCDHCKRVRLAELVMER